VSDELNSAREKKRQTEEKAKQYYDKIRKQEAEVAKLRKELTSSQSKLGDLRDRSSRWTRRRVTCRTAWTA
jgi:chromosome segregation ATPase